MSENAKGRGLLDHIHLGASIIVLGLGGFISWKQLGIESNQKEISRRLQVTEQSAQLLENAREYLDALNLDGAKNKGILLSLLKIEKEIRVSETGELADKQVRSTVDALPYHLALLAEDSELSLILADSRPI